MSTEMIRHAFHGTTVRTFADEHGEPWFILGDLCQALGIANVGNVVARLDADVVGSIRLTDGTPGNPNRATVSEPGMYEVVLRSDSPAAVPFRRWVTTDVLPSIRKTGRYETAALTGTELIARAVIEAQQIITRQEQRIAELEPPAQAWAALADATGDYSLRDAAQILSRDPDIEIGQNRLSRYLRQVGWLDRGGVPYQSHVAAGRVTARVRTYEHPRTGERMQAAPQVRITAKGLTWLHQHLGGTAPLASGPHLVAVGS